MDKMYSQFDLASIYDTITTALEFFLNYSSRVPDAGAEWGEYGWVPFLPQDNIINLIGSVNVPATHEEADALMLKKLEKTSSELFIEIQKYIEKFEGNEITYSEAVQSYNSGLYTSCALDLFAVIDRIFITSQAKPNEPKAQRKLAKKALEVKYKESKKAPYVVIAVAVKRIIDTVFKFGEDFDPEIEGEGNRNFISHGMNKKIPDKVFCLKLFVLLYNTCLLLSSGIFSREGDLT